MSPSQWFLLLGTAAASTIVLAPSGAEAYTRRLSASACYVDRIGYDNVEFSSPVGAWNQNTTARLNLSCPIPDDDDFPKSLISGINVRGYDGNNESGSDARVYATACITYWGVHGGLCEGSATTGTTWTGNFTLHPTLTPWANAFDFGYLAVRLPAYDSAASVLRGISISN